MTMQAIADRTLDAASVLLALDRGDVAAVDAMVGSYARSGELLPLTQSFAAIALCAVRYSACAAGQTPERLLAGIAAEIRGDVAE